jgi:beta-N-acetylhexosaminidase
VDVAARLLYQELTPTGASPVSISGVGYDLITALTPDPNRIIPLFLDFATDTAITDLSTTPEPTPNPLFKIGDTISLRTGVIYDHNGNPVPDGTVVHFAMILTGEGGGILPQIDTVTIGGIGRASFGLDKPGQLEIRVTSESAVSYVMQLNVSSTGSVIITVVVPVPSETIVPASTPVGTPAEKEDKFVTLDGYPRFSAWFIIMLMLAGAATLGYWSGMRLYGPHAGIRWALGIILGGLSAYTYLALGLLGAATWTASNGFNGIIILSLIGILIGWAFGWWWSRRI